MDKTGVFAIEGVSGRCGWRRVGVGSRFPRMGDRWRRHLWLGWIPPRRCLGRHPPAPRPWTAAVLVPAPTRGWVDVLTEGSPSNPNGRARLSALPAARRRADVSSALPGDRTVTRRSSPGRAARTCARLRRRGRDPVPRPRSGTSRRPCLVERSRSRRLRRSQSRFR